MGLRFPTQKDCSCFFVTTTFVNHHPYGDQAGMYAVLADSLYFYCRKYDARIAAYVLMSTHLHLLLFIDGKLLSEFMRDFKKYVTQKATREIGVVTDRLWMPRYDRVAIESAEVFRVKLEYIHNNPVKAGMCSLPEGWYWSSAADYCAERVGPVTLWKEWL